ncbi:MAG: F0F1 ATP synthase subunit B [Candidatus Omnitrophota bacterium]|jgi:F-type H+-transporting ATPase subunit b
MELLKLLSGSEIVAQVLSFLLLLFVLRVFAWKKILALLDQRKERIAAEFRNIEDTKLQVARIRDEYEAKLKGIEAAAKLRIQEAVVDSRKIVEDSRKKAHEEAQEIITNAQASVKYELSKAKQELKKEIVDLAIGAAENVIQERLTEAEDRKLVEDFLKRMDDVG